MNTNQTNRPRRSGSGAAKSSRPSGGRKFSGGGGRPQRSGVGRRGGSGGGGRRGGGRKLPTFDPSQFINTNPVEVVEEVYEPKNTFETFGLQQKLVDTIHGMGITIPSPIQDQIISEILEGKDVIGLAETGTGKTAAFLVPLIEMTATPGQGHRQTLVLTPTRELAIQIQDELRKLSRGFTMYSTTCVGGMNIRPQIKSLRRSNQFIIGTPGRVMDLMERGHIDMSNITTVVLDEADRMLDMGFIHDMRKIISQAPKTRETLFFSATMAPSVKKLTGEFLNDPVVISVKKKDVTNSIEQNVVPFVPEEKFNTLLDILQQPDAKRVIVFGAMKHAVKKLADDLSKAGISSDSLHGNKTHGQRQKALDRFKKGTVKVLVATDVAARGIHVDNVSHVINYELPSSFEDYVHRIGRTGRGAEKGKALTFVPKRR